MSEQFFSISPAADSPMHWTLLHEYAGAHCRVLPKYADLACRRCKKMDTLAALRRGLPDVAIPAQFQALDCLVSQDYLLVLSALAKASFEAATLKVEFHSISGSDRFVAFPLSPVLPPVDARILSPVEEPAPGEAFQVRGRRCAECGRPRISTFHAIWFEPPAGSALVAAQVEVGVFGAPSFAWIASSATAKSLQGQRGWNIRNLKEERERIARVLNRPRG